MEIKHRILFVDDEQPLLDGLKRSLRSQRNVWEMVFTSSGEEALRLADERHFDVVVADMRMPGINGAELLGRLSEKCPDMIRLILSGHSDETLILKAVPYAHQFLSKPCDAEVIKHVITRSLKLKALVKDHHMQARVSQIRSLPTLPELYVKLTDLLNSEQVSVQQVGEVIGQDPAMVSKILQMVNSAFFGIGHHISSPAQAATMLGTETLRGLVLSAGIFMQFDTKSLNVGGFTLEALHRHSLQVSRLARGIAVSMGAEEQVVEDSLLAGLLHDIGRLVLVQSLPNEYQEFIDKMHDCQIGLLEAERAAFHVDHGRIGAYLLGLWALPDSLVEAVAYHHEPHLSGNFSFSPLLAVHVADALASTHSTDASIIPVGLNIDYLTASGVTDRLDEWRALHSTLLTEVG